MERMGEPKLQEIEIQLEGRKRSRDHITSRRLQGINYRRVQNSPLVALYHYT